MAHSKIRNVMFRSEVLDMRRLIAQSGGWLLTAGAGSRTCGSAEGIGGREIRVLINAATRPTMTAGKLISEPQRCSKNTEYKLILRLLRHLVAKVFTEAF
jgi:hypothetical protein